MKELTYQFVHSVPEDLQDMSESFHPDDEGTGASTSQESLEASPAHAVATAESEVEGNVQARVTQFYAVPFCFRSVERCRMRIRT